MGNIASLTYSFSVLLALMLAPLFSNGADFKNFTTEDQIFSKKVRTVKFYRSGSTPYEIFNTAATNLNQEDRLILEFDILGEEAAYLYVKIFHCNADWSQSDLAAPEYLVDYNEFLIEDYAFSFNTATPFTHYTFNIPRVLVSGNYVLGIYESDKPDELLLTRRFFIYENIIEIIPEFKFSSNVQGRNSLQEIAFELRYKNVEIQDPSTEINCSLRQNFRWDNAKTQLSPLFFDLTSNTIDYRYFDGENAFLGGNEFREFATRHLNFTDINLESVDGKNRIATLLPAQTRSDRPFVNAVDINGKFYIENSRGNTVDLDGEYLTTIFKFSPKTKYPGRIFVMGELSDWKLKPEFELLYDKEKNWYITASLLKQGYYNYYLHYQKGPDENTPFLNEHHLEGSFFQTENVYEIIVYHRPPGGRIDRILGYLVKDFLE